MYGLFPTNTKELFYKTVVVFILRLCYSSKLFLSILLIGLGEGEIPVESHPLRCKIKQLTKDTHEKFSHKT